MFGEKNMTKDMVIRKLAEVTEFEEIDEFEQTKITDAGNLLELEYPGHSLMDIWNAAAHNLRRRIEAYSVDMFVSSVSTLSSGRRKYNEKGETLSERWSEVDDSVLIYGASQLKLIDKKTEKSLEMVNWMRNHASAAHESDFEVKKTDVIGLVQILAPNLFNTPMPDPVHSPISLIEAIKNDLLDDRQIELFKEQISNYRKSDIKIMYGFSMNQIITGELPAYDNITKLFPTIWELIDEESKKNIGKKYYDLSFSSTEDSSADKKALSRLFEQIVIVNGVGYMPDSCRSAIYRELAKKLAKAKDTVYGWASENAESRALAQVGPYVPASVYEDVYQEILCVWCGNYWGRSEAHNILEDFIFTIPHKDMIKVIKLFKTNKRAQEELFLPRPKKRAMELMERIKSELKIDAQKNVIDEVMEFVRQFNII